MREVEDYDEFHQKKSEKPYDIWYTRMYATWKVDV